MKKTRKMSLYIFLVLFIGCILSPAYCETMTNAKSKTINIEAGSKSYIKINGRIKKGTWRSGNKKIATVNKKGYVKTQKTGKTVITAKINHKTYKYNLYVRPKLTSLKITNTSNTLIKGSKKQLTYKVNNKKAIKSITYLTSNPAIATISSNGTITAKKFGNVTIKIKVTSYGTKKKGKTTIPKSLTKSMTFTVKQKTSQPDNGNDIGTEVTDTDTNDNTTTTTTVKEPDNNGKVTYTYDDLKEYLVQSVDYINTNYYSQLPTNYGTGTKEIVLPTNSVFYTTPSQIDPNITYNLSLHSFIAMSSEDNKYYVIYDDKSTDHLIGNMVDNKDSNITLMTKISLSPQDFHSFNTDLLKGINTNNKQYYVFYTMKSGSGIVTYKTYDNSFTMKINVRNEGSVDGYSYGVAQNDYLSYINNKVSEIRKQYPNFDSLTTLEKIGIACCSIEPATDLCTSDSKRLTGICYQLGIPCTSRDASYDGGYANHANNLVYIPEEHSIYIVSVMTGTYKIRYTCFFDEKAHYLSGKSTYYETNYYGKNDINLPFSYYNTILNQLIVNDTYYAYTYYDFLVKAGYDVTIDYIEIK